MTTRTREQQDEEAFLTWFASAYERAAATLQRDEDGLVMGDPLAVMAIQNDSDARNWNRDTPGRPYPYRRVR
jgi:hypothetical protein